MPERPTQSRDPGASAGSGDRREGEFLDEFPDTDGPAGARWDHFWDPDGHDGERDEPDDGDVERDGDDRDELDEPEGFAGDDGVDGDDDGFDRDDEEADGGDGGRVVELPRYDPLPDDRLRAVLTEGEVELVGRMPYSSNGTFLTDIRLGDDGTLAIFKPALGERPLWDFPPGLWQREVAAFEVSEALGWHLVPMTVTREVAPLGVGSLQRFIHARFEEHYFTLVEETEHHPALRRFCAFDVVANNTDRKGGHILIDDDKRLWGIDHGLCFGTSSHLRTVIWDFGGDELSDDEQAALRRLADEPPAVLDDLLTVTEVRELCTRARRLAEIGALPFVPERHRGYPWPML